MVKASTAIVPETPMGKGDIRIMKQGQSAELCCGLPTPGVWCTTYSHDFSKDFEPGKAWKPHYRLQNLRFGETAAERKTKDARREENMKKPKGNAVCSLNRDFAIWPDDQKHVLPRGLQQGQKTHDQDPSLVNKIEKTYLARLPTKCASDVDKSAPWQIQRKRELELEFKDSQAAYQKLMRRIKCPRHGIYAKKPHGFTTLSNPCVENVHDTMPEDLPAEKEKAPVPPGDLMEPRPLMLEGIWKGIKVPSDDPMYVSMLPALESSTITCDLSPFAFMPRRRKYPPSWFKAIKEELIPSPCSK